MECLFCGDIDFDLVGLKGHIVNSCEVFEQTETPLLERLRKQNESAKPYD